MVRVVPMSREVVLPLLLVVGVSGALVATPHSLAATDSVERTGSYQEVRTLFDQHCVQCHGAKRQEAGLRLDSAIGIRRGSDQGPLANLEEPDASRLIQAVEGSLPATQRMPAKAPALATEEIDRLRQWIALGAPTEDDGPEKPIESDHWAFRSPQVPSLPNVNDHSWPKNSIDHFVLAQLERRNLAPSPTAEKSTLARRVALDLTGVPLSPAEWATYMADSSAHAYERLVDRLLTSPKYGERWGRHWLDQARYADSNGFTRDFAREIWKYRDWVIDAINANMPFDEFVITQLAGDMLPNATLEQQIATGFHRNTLINEEGGTDPEQFRVDAIADRVATTGSVFLGLTLGCARCHPHKYDPISQREYYEVFALLNNCDEPTIDAPSLHQRRRGDLKERERIRARIKALDKEIEALGETFLEAQFAWETTITPEYRATLLGPVQASLDLSPEERTPEQKGLVRDLYMGTENARQQFQQIAEIHRLKQAEPVIPTTLVLKERSETRETFIHRRGNFLDHGARVFPGTPKVLPAMASKDGTADRLDFARWLVSDSHPLTARVTVNRYWLRFFGQGLVKTENDFGTQGDPPTHPELLDWLAREFIQSDWNTKRLHRLIVTSATYRQSSRFRPDLKQQDPANQWLARQSRIRLDAEIIRDSALAVSGQMTDVIGGPSVYPPQPEGVFEFTQDPKPWPTTQGPDRYRRGLYTYLWRSSPYPALTMFDAPDGNISCTQRNRSNTPMQALTLANDVQFIECAQSLATQILMQGHPTDEARIRALYIRCLSRLPTGAEISTLARVIESASQSQGNDPASIKDFLNEGVLAAAEDQESALGMVFAARVLLNTDEFITRE